MKVLKYTGIAIALVLVIFLGTGLFIARFGYGASVQVNATPEKCWEVLHDTSRMKKWIPGFVSLTLTQGEYLQAGSVYEIILVQDKMYRMQETLTEVNPPKEATYVLVNDVMKSEYGFQLIESPVQTEIRMQYMVTGNNLIWQSILLLSKSHLQKNAQGQLDSLKVEIETGD
jgi:carbon monoxide dehydrogenase subunit G